MDGIINVYKERGYTSFDVVAKLRGILHERRIGHTGTLDPDAEGVLPVCVGSATKACGLLLDKEKEYEAVLLFGVETDTQDITGKVLKRSAVTAGYEEAKEALLSFVGTYGQIPPMYSALKVNGKKLYELAREGRVVERAARPVTIYSIKVLSGSFPEEGSCQERFSGQSLPAESTFAGEKTIRFRITCSKGTYIRTLCEDVGRKLGCGGCMKSLKRTRVGSFLEDGAHTLSEIGEICAADKVQEILLPTDRLFLNYPALFMREGANQYLYNGNKLKQDEVVLREEGQAQDTPCFRVYDSAGNFCALYCYDRGEGCYRNVKMFMPRQVTLRETP